MPTIQQIIQAPDHLSDLGDIPVLVLSGSREEIIIGQASGSDDDSARSGFGPEPTALFSHETIAMMRAERAEQIEQLAGQISLDSTVYPIEPRSDSVWQEVTVGRGENADITLDDGTVSAMHASFEIEQHDVPYVIKDTNSSNGTFINRVRIQPLEETPVKSGDCIRFGHTITYFLSAKMLRRLVKHLADT